MSKIWCHKAIRGATRNLTWPATGASRPKNRYTGDHPGPKPMNPALFESGSDAFHQPQVASGRGEAHISRGGYVALWAPISVWSITLTLYLGPLVLEALEAFISPM